MKAGVSVPNARLTTSSYASQYNRQLRDLIIAGKAKPSFVASHHIGIDEAPDAYVKFSESQ